MNKFEETVELLKDLKKNEFTGVIRINYNQGGITFVEKSEVILKKTRHK